MSRKSIDSAPRSPTIVACGRDLFFIDAQGIDQGGLHLLEDFVLRHGHGSCYSKLTM